MRARLLLRERRIVSEGRFVEIVIWQLPNPALGSVHAFKYRLAFVVDEECVLRFDNETGKGDHKHVGTEEVPTPSRAWLSWQRISGTKSTNGTQNDCSNDRHFLR
jgi:hypothetical protein